MIFALRILWPFVPQNDAIKLRTPDYMNAVMTSMDTKKQKMLYASGGLHLRVYTEIEDVREIWLHLEKTGLSTIYQTYAWCSAWLKRLAPRKSITAHIVVAENEFGIVEFILPLQRRISKGIAIIEILTAPQAGYGFGLFNRDFLSARAADWFASHFEHLTATLPRHDVLLLTDLPSVVMGSENPLLAVRHFLASNQSHIMGLETDYEALYQRRRSLVSRKSIRKRDAKLEAQPGLVFDIPENDLDCLKTMQTMFHQQEARLAEAGVHNIFDTDERQFFCDLTTSHADVLPILKPFRLRVDNDTIAVLLGGYHQGGYWALISSMSEGEFKRLSPGDYILRRIIQKLCENGTLSLDFSAGDSPYKYHWSDRQVPLNFIVRCNSLKGLPIALLFLLSEKLKRVGKRTPVLNTFLLELRKALKGRKTAD